MLYCFFFVLQWPTRFSKRREGGREKLVANARPRHGREHVPHHRDRGGEVQQTPP